MPRVRALLTRTIGALLIALGAVLFASPQISYTAREEIAHTGLKVKREKAVVIPRPVAVLIVAAGAAALILPSRELQL